MKSRTIKKKVLKPFVCLMTVSAVMVGICSADAEGTGPAMVYAATQDTAVTEKNKDNFSWNIVDGTLTIKSESKGNITIPDYTDNAGDKPAPWSSARSAVGYSRIVFDCNGVITIGENAFIRDNNNKSLGNITLKGKSARISKGAFKGHTNIPFMGLYVSPVIEEGAFEKDAVQRVAFYNNRPVEGLKYAVNSKATAEVHRDIDAGLREQLETIGVSKIDPKLCDQKELSDEQPENIFKTTYKCSVCGYSQTRPSSFKTKFIAEGIDSKFFEEYKKRLTQKGYELKDKDIHIKEKKGDTVANDTGSLDDFRDMFGYKYDREHFAVTDSNGNSITTSSCKDGFTPEKFPEKITSRSEEFNITMKYTPADTVFHLDGGDHYKKRLEDIHRKGLVLNLPELKSEEESYEFIGWKLDKINDRNIDIVNSNHIYDESKIIKAGAYDLVDFYTDMALIGQDNSQCEYTLKAVWTEIGSFDLIFDPNGGGGTAITEKRFLNPDKAEIAGEHFETAGKPGHVFTGWNTQPDGRGISFDVLDKISGASFGDTEIGKNEKVTLYAQWAAPRKINISFEWNDNDNSDGKRPSTVGVDVTTSSSLYSSSNTYNLATDKSSEIIVRTKHAKASYNSEGKATYFKTEDTSMNIRISDSFSIPSGYAVELKNPSENNYVISMKYSNEKIRKEVKISFKDNDNNDGKRPEELKIVLKDKEGNKYEKKAKISKTETTVEFDNLNAMYGKGLRNEFTVATPEADGYTFKVNGSIITAEHKDESVDYTVKTVWKDNNDSAKRRPETYSLTLEGEGNRYTQNISGNGANTVEGVKRYYRGKEISYNYTVSNITGYTSSVTSDGKEITVTYEYGANEDKASEIAGKGTTGKTNSAKSKNVTGTGKNSSGSSKSKASKKGSSSIDSGSRLEDDDYSNFTVRLIWDDEENKSEREDVTVALIGSDDETYEGILTEENGYTYVFSHIPLIEEDGTIIKYDVVPNTTRGYKSSVYNAPDNPTKFIITNRKDTEKTLDGVVKDDGLPGDVHPVFGNVYKSEAGLDGLNPEPLVIRDEKPVGLILAGIAVAVVGTVLTVFFIRRKRR